MQEYINVYTTYIVLKRLIMKIDDLISYIQKSTFTGINIFYSSYISFTQISISSLYPKKTLNINTIYIYVFTE